MTVMTFEETLGRSRAEHFFLLEIFFFDFKIPIGKGTFTIRGGKMIRKIVA
jgi:hypothetical protein